MVRFASFRLFAPSLILFFPPLSLLLDLSPLRLHLSSLLLSFPLLLPTIFLFSSFLHSPPFLFLPPPGHLLPSHFLVDSPSFLLRPFPSEIRVFLSSLTTIVAFVPAIAARRFLTTPFGFFVTTPFGFFFTTSCIIVIIPVGRRLPGFAFVPRTVSSKHLQRVDPFGTLSIIGR